LIFFLGGIDLEMVMIRELLERCAPGQWRDLELAWGAKTSAYSKEIEAVLAAGLTPVLVELEDDMGLDAQRVVVIDHHGGRAGAGQPTSLEQVFALLELSPEEWTRWYELVAANDRGYVPGLVAAGATAEEIREVRAADRRAQGITEAEERAAEQALKTLQVLAGGELTVAMLPHARTAALADRLETALGGVGGENLLIRSPGQLNFFGAGKLVVALDAEFPGGWYGGALPDRGYWGHSAAPFTFVQDFLLDYLARQRQTA
jgi:hypothetical protein